MERGIIEIKLVVEDFGEGINVENNTKIENLSGKEIIHALAGAVNEVLEKISETPTQEIIHKVRFLRALEQSE